MRRIWLSNIISRYYASEKYNKYIFYLKIKRFKKIFENKERIKKELEDKKKKKVVEALR